MGRGEFLEDVLVVLLGFHRFGEGARQSGIHFPGRWERRGLGGAFGSLPLVLFVLVWVGWWGCRVGLHAVVGPLRVQGMLVGVWGWGRGCQ